MVIGRHFLFPGPLDSLKWMAFQHGLWTSNTFQPQPLLWFEFKGASEICILLRLLYYRLASIASLDIIFHFNTISINLLSLFEAIWLCNHKFISPSLLYISCTKILIGLFKVHIMITFTLFYLLKSFHCTFWCWFISKILSFLNQLTLLI